MPKKENHYQHSYTQIILSSKKVLQYLDITLPLLQLET